MATVLELRTPDDAGTVAATLLKTCPSNRVFTFNGPLGAGKTTLIKALCGQLGVVGGMSSPTFSIVNEYRTHSGKTVYHFDLYRLNKPEELDGIGFNEYLDSGSYCFVEWPALAEGLYPPESVHVQLLVETDNTRKLMFNTATTTHELRA